jgi:hypothetical protein
MNTTQLPVVELYNNGVLLADVTYSIFSSSWLNDTTFHAVFNVIDNNLEIAALSLQVNFGQDVSGNGQNLNTSADWINLDTKNPAIVVLTANTYMVNATTANFQLIAIFDEAIDNATAPVFDFAAAQNVNSILSVDAGSSSWINSFTYKSVYDIQNVIFIEPEVDVEIQQVFDMAGNPIVPLVFDNYFAINTEPLGLSNKVQSNSTFIYPNPIENGAKLSLVTEGNHETITRLSIMSSDGKLVFNELLNPANNGVQSINIPDLNPGVYFLIGYTSQSQQEWKLIVRK